VPDALKCVVWGGRVLVVGFAGGEIEKVSIVTLVDEGSDHSLPGIHRYLWTATSQPRTSQACLDHRDLLGFLS